MFHKWWMKWSTVSKRVSHALGQDVYPFHAQHAFEHTLLICHWFFPHGSLMSSYSALAFLWCMVCWTQPTREAVEKMGDGCSQAGKKNGQKPSVMCDFIFVKPPLLWECDTNFNASLIWIPNCAGVNYYILFSTWRVIFHIEDVTEHPATSDVAGHLESGKMDGSSSAIPGKKTFTMAG